MLYLFTSAMKVSSNTKYGLARSLSSRLGACWPFLGIRGLLVPPCLQLRRVSTVRYDVLYLGTVRYRILCDHQSPIHHKFTIHQQSLLQPVIFNKTLQRSYHRNPINHGKNRISSSLLKYFVHNFHSFPFFPSPT